MNRRISPATRGLALTLCALSAVCLFGLMSLRVLALNPNAKISQYGHTTWRVGQAGLSGIPTAIAQTIDGYIWIGTTDGLYRFDGVVFTRWISEDGNRLPNQDIYSLLGARNGSLYVGTGGGLARVTHGHLYTYPGGLLNIRPLIEDQQGTIWLGQRGDENGSHVLCRAGDRLITCLGTKEGFEVLGGYSIFSDGPGSVWVGNRQGIDHWRQEAMPETYPFVDSRTNHSADMYVTAFAAGEGGSLWAGLAGAGPGRGLLRFTSNGWKSYVTPQVDGSKLSVRHLLSDSGDVLWIGTIANGLYKLHDNTLDHFDTTYGLTGDAVNGIFKDKEGDVWILTDGGVDVFRDLSILPFSTREGLSDDSAQAVEIAPNHDVWIGTRHALNVIHNRQISILTLGHGLPTDSLSVLYRDSRNTMWISDQTGRLFFYREGRFTAVSTEKDGANYFAAYDITEDNKGQIWLIGLGPARKNVLLRVEGTHIAEKVDAPDGQIMLTAPHPQKGLWAGGLQHGLFWLHDGQFEQIEQKSFNEGVFRLKAEPNGVLWIFTARHNIFRYQDGRMQRLTTQNGLPCDTGYQIVDDHAGSRWLYLSCGIVSFRDEELDRWWHDPAYRINARVFDVTSGFRPGVGVVASTKPVLASDGKIWSATSRIVQMIDTRHLPWNNLPPPVHIEHLVVDHTEQRAGDNLKLRVSPREIEIDYAALSYVVPDKVRFRYRLEGHDRDWTEAGIRRQAFYNDLDPGRYTFQVLACNNDGVWNTQGARLNFMVPPSWYQTLWFRLLCVFLAMAAIYSVYLIRMRQFAATMKMRFNERLEERTRIARELHDTLLQGVQGLMLRFQAVMKALPQDEPPYRMMEKALDRADELLLEGRQSVRELRAEGITGNDLPEALARCGNEFVQDHSAGFSVTVIGTPRPLEPTVCSEAYSVGREALTNAFEHANASKIEAELTFQTQSLRLVVRDDGQGIAPGILEAGLAGHWGLSGMRERAEKVGGRLNIWSQIEGGTEVDLVIPGKLAYARGTEPSLWNRVKQKLSRTEGEPPL